jgi:hypothetical protein
MREFLVLLVHLVGIVVRLAKPCGVRSVVAESVLVRQQLLLLNAGASERPTCALRIVSSRVCARFSFAGHGFCVLPSC